MNEAYKFGKGSLIRIKRGGQLEESFSKGGWWHHRPIISFNEALRNFVPRSGNNLEDLASHRYILLYSKAN